MFCPNCKAEYRSGFSECSECHVPLVSALPVPPPRPEAPELNLVTVFRSADPAVISVASSILQSAEIPFATKGEGLQDLFAWGRVHGGTNIFVGPVEVQVDEKDSAEATALLEGVTASTTGDLEIRESDTPEILIETRH